MSSLKQIFKKLLVISTLSYLGDIFTLPDFIWPFFSMKTKQKNTKSTPIKQQEVHTKRSGI